MFGGTRVVKFLLVMLALMVEGFDLQAVNFAGPSIAATFGIDRAQLGPLLSASLVGVLLGSTQAAPLGDRYGRKRFLVIGSVLFGVLSLLAARATSIPELLVLRFLIGIGLGGVLPNGLALAGEISPPERQASMIGLASIGITAGGVVAGVTAARVLPVYGWQGLFVVGGLLPLPIALLIGLALPSSKGPCSVGQPTRGPAGHAFGGLRTVLTPPLRSMTMLIWLVFTVVAMNFYLLSGWIPLLMRGSGLSMAGAAWVTTAFHIGGVIGGVCASLALTRGGWRTAAAFMASGALMMTALAFLHTSSYGTILLIVLSGFSVTGSLTAINGATGGAYPAHLRSTGLGWALGMARVGSILGPLVGSLAALLNLDRDNRFFMLPVVPLALVSLAAVQLARHDSRVPMQANGNPTPS